MKTRNVSIIIINENGFITEILSAFPLPPVGTRVVVQKDSGEYVNLEILSYEWDILYTGITYRIKTKTV